MNLLNETLEAIKASGHKIQDIIFIGSVGSGHYCTWEEFTTLANHEYDNGFGAPAVAQDLRIVFSDKSSMWRGEYDGSEWWEFRKPFEKPLKQIKIQSLFARSIGWEDLEDINKLE